MSAINLIATARDQTFAARIMMLSFQMAATIAAEDPGTADHAERLAYCNRIYRGEENPKLLAAHTIMAFWQIIQAIEANPSALGSNVTDDQINTGLAVVWSARAKAFAAGAP